MKNIADCQLAIADWRIAQTVSLPAVLVVQWKISTQISLRYVTKINGQSAIGNEVVANWQSAIDNRK